MIPKFQKRYLTGPQVRARFGGRSHPWLWRQLRDNPRFPRPHRINGQLYFSESELEAYEASCRVPFVVKVKEAIAEV